MKKRVLYTVLLFVVASFIGLYYINKTIFSNTQKAVYDNISKVLHTVVNNNKQDLLNISSTLAQTQILKDAILASKSSLADEFLEEVNANLRKNFQSDKVFIQVLTKDFLYCTQNTQAYMKKNFERYYDKSLNSIKNSKSSVVDINVRNYLHLKATTTLIEKNELLGFVEVVSLYDIIVQNMRRHKIELIPLLDKQKVSSAYVLKDNPSVAHDFIVANENYNKRLLKKLQTLLPKDMEQLLVHDYVYKNGLFFAAFAMRNKQGEVLGKYITILNQQGFDYLNQTNQSFLENIMTINNSSEDFYNFVKHEEENMFMNIEKGYIKNLKDVVDKRDQVEFEEVARDKLLNLSKEELVDFILQQSKHSEIRGKIE